MDKYNQLLINIQIKFTKYFVASEEFLNQNNVVNMKPLPKMFVNDCIKRVVDQWIVKYITTF